MKQKASMLIKYKNNIKEICKKLRKVIKSKSKKCRI